MKVLYLVILLFVVASVSILFREYFRQPDKASEKDIAIKLSAAQLISAFNENEERANQQYLGKWIEVEGDLIGIDTTNPTTTHLLVGDTNNMHNLQVELEKSTAGNSFSLHQPISVKGVCTGYLMDVQMNRAVINPNN